jgi:hypothetical protein
MALGALPERSFFDQAELPKFLNKSGNSTPSRGQSLKKLKKSWS